MCLRSVPMRSSYTEVVKRLYTQKEANSRTALTPLSVFSLAGEFKRQAVNAWIRTSGEYADVIDFDRVLRDPNSPSKILAVYDGGDHGPNRRRLRGAGECSLIPKRRSVSQ